MLKLREGALAWREVDGRAVLLDLEASMYLEVNESGSLLWRLLAEGTTREALVGALVDAYDLPADQAAADVDELLEDCRARGYLEAHPER